MFTNINASKSKLRVILNNGQIANVIVGNLLENAFQKLHQLKRQYIHSANTTAQMATMTDFMHVLN